MGENGDSGRSFASLGVGLLAVGVGLAAFLVPLHHAGPYSLPGRGLVGGLLCFVIAAVLLTQGTPKILRLAAYLASPAVLFVALYGAMAELEEVIILESGGASLRLWIVDADGSEWVSMPRSKAEMHDLDGTRHERLRKGKSRCIVPRIVDDETINRRTFDLRQEKYAVQRLAQKLGLFGDGPGPETVTLRLDPCGAED